MSSDVRPQHGRQPVQQNRVQDIITADDARGAGRLFAGADQGVQFCFDFLELVPAALQQPLNGLLKSLIFCCQSIGAAPEP